MYHLQGCWLAVARGVSLWHLMAYSCTDVHDVPSIIYALQLSYGLRCAFVGKLYYNLNLFFEHACNRTRRAGECGRRKRLASTGGEGAAPGHDMELLEAVCVLPTNSVLHFCDSVPES